MAAEQTMRALVWLADNDPDWDPAEGIVRAAYLSRWAPARFFPCDVDRAVRAIRGDRRYLRDVAEDADRTASRAGYGFKVLRGWFALVKDQAP